MADRTIEDLPELSTVTDDSMLPVAQSGTAYHTKGASWKQFVRDAIADLVALVQSAAGQASQDATRAETAAASASADKTAIQGMGISSTVLSPGATPTLSKTESGGVWTLHFGLAPGAQGPQGNDGPAGPQGNTQINNYTSNYYTASAQPATGTIYFNVNDEGHLIMTYAGNTAPAYSIDQDPLSPTYGHLLWEVD